MRLNLPKIAVRLVLATAAAATASVLIPASSASAATGPVFIENHASTYYWPIGTAKSFVDQYTGTYFVWGACRSGYKCIKIYERTINSNWAAVTYNWSWGSQIYLNPQRRYYSWYAKRSIVTHELAHTRGVWWHTYGCTDVMHANVFCAGGKLPPYRFDAAQRATLYRY